MVLENFVIEERRKVVEAMKRIDESGIGTVVVVGEDGQVKGTISDGDIRKAILSGIDVNEEKVSEIMRKDPIILYRKDLSNERLVNMAGRLLFERNPRGGFIPVLSNEEKMVDLLHFSGFGKENYKKLERENGGAFVKNVKKVLIVGGAGYLGSILTRKLLQNDYQVKVLDIFSFGKDPLKELENNPALEIVEGDVRDISTVSTALDGVDAVIHLAAIVGDPAGKSKPLDTIETNYLATKTLAEACKYRQINRFLYASTCSVYGQGEDILTEESPLNPLSHYARTKIKSEQGILGLTDSNFSPSIMRMSTLYGLSPRMRFDLVANVFAMKAVTEKKITVFGGEQWRPLLHVEDAADSYTYCLEAPIERIKGQVFNVGTEKENYKIIELGKMVKSIFPDTEIEIIKKEEDKRDYKVSFEKIRDRLNFNPKITVKEGILEIKKAIESGVIKDVKNKVYYNHL